MAVQFAHKPIGSTIGNGSYVFRHYGEETSLITFYVNPLHGGTDNYVCKAPANVSMTWYEWCQSEYNTFGFFCAETGIVHKDNWMNNVCYDSSNDVRGSDVIIADHVYYWYPD